MKTRQTISIFIVFVSSIITVLILIVALSANGTAVAQNPQPTTGEGDRSPATSIPQQVFGGDGATEAAQPRDLTPFQDFGLDAPNSPSVSFSYYRIIGTAFQPRKSTTTFDYSTNGCMYQTGGSDIRFQAPVLLPPGSTIKYVRFYYNDTVAENMTVWLTTYQNGSSSLDLTNVSSSGTAGLDSALSAEITHTVDTYNNAYVLNWGPGVMTSGNQICGVRIAYYVPYSSAAYLPTVERNVTP